MGLASLGDFWQKPKGKPYTRTWTEKIKHEKGPFQFRLRFPDPTKVPSRGRASKATGKGQKRNRKTTREASNARYTKYKYIRQGPPPSVNRRHCMRTHPTAISESRREGPTVKGRVSRVQYTGVECTLSRGTPPWNYRNVHNSSPHTTTSVGRFSCPDCTLSIGDSRWGPNAPRDTPRKEVSQGRLGENVS